MFNIQGSEMIFLLLVALIILGPEKLPDAIRKFGRAYSEFKKMANGFQGELRSALDEPMRELKDTADMMRNAVNFDDGATPVTTDEPAAPPPPVKREQGLNFGSANPRRTTAAADDEAAAAKAQAAAADGEAQKPAGLNFGGASTIRKGPRSVRDPLAAADLPVVTPPAVAADADLPADDVGDAPSDTASTPGSAASEHQDAAE